jgi:hypothetical protein
MLGMGQYPKAGDAGHAAWEPGTKHAGEFLGTLSKLADLRRRQPIGY